MTTFDKKESRQNTPTVFLVTYLIAYTLYFLILGLTGRALGSGERVVGILGILAGVSFMLSKETPKNFGFITLAGSLLLWGLNLELMGILSYSFYLLSGILAFLAVIFLIIRREMSMNVGFILAASFQIWLLISGFLSFPYAVDSLVSGILAISAAVFLLVRK
jgi:hypothetical protein